MIDNNVQLKTEKKEACYTRAVWYASFSYGRSCGHMRELRFAGVLSIWTQYLYGVGSDAREADGYNSHCSGPTLKVDVEMGVLKQCRKASDKLEDVVLHP